VGSTAIAEAYCGGAALRWARSVGVTPKLAAAVALASLAIVLPAFAAAPAQPSPRESIGSVIARIEASLHTTGCGPKLKMLFHSAYGKVKKAGCTYLRKGLGTFKAPRGVAYGTAAEIDAGTGYAQPATTVLALDADRRFHVVFIQFDYGSIGSKPNPGFDRNVQLAIAAIRRADCTAFVKVAFRGFGLGGGPETAVCARLPKNSLHKALAADPHAKLVKLGGNTQYAFYGLTVGGRYYTVVMANQPPSAKLPIDAAQYAYVDAYPAS
jgi:hypothetical protein